MVLAIELPADEITFAQWKVRYFAHEWLSETPIRIHKHTNTDGAAPDFSDEFAGYMDQSLADARQIKSDRSKPVDYYADSPRSRVVKAFRKLRWKAPREFFVLYGMCAIDQCGWDVKLGDNERMQSAFDSSIRRATHRLNEKVGAPLFSENDVLILAVSGLRKLTLWAG
jgi:hypothetical protein